jgi:hypothetical protein
MIGLHSVSAKTGTVFHTAAKETPRLHQMHQFYAQQMSTSKTDLYLYIPRRSAKEKTSKLFPLGPLTTSKKQNKTKKKKKKSKTKTTRKKKKKKKQGNERAMKKSFTATKNKCQINPGNA